MVYSYMSYGFYDITLYYYDNDFNIESEFAIRQNEISKKYVQLMNKYKPPKTTRISVELKDEDDILFYNGSILCVEAAFDKNYYWSLNSLQQNIMILETVHRIALLCAKKYSWNLSIFESSYRSLLDEIQRSSNFL